MLDSDLDLVIGHRVHPFVPGPSGGAATKSRAIEHGFHGILVSTWMP
ncbi:MAG: hypothetical protein P4M00_04660 [Azospirillaceae bacterium]|nr:hypothetical protein [Azospirillaceae bacterium]